MRPAQIYWLLRFRWLPRPRRLPNAVVRPSGCQPLAAFIAPPSRQRIEGKVTFLHDQQTFEGGLPDWRALDKPKLWRYNLHYFDYLLWPAVSDARKAALIESWIARNPQGSPDAWEPYPVSLRIVNWIKYLVFSGSSTPAPTAWSDSLALQATWLERNLERHILANHYLKNAKALVFAGLFFSGRDADRWLRLGREILAEQITEQFLPDGGHYELSPMYHCICLEDLLDTWNFARTAEGRVPASALSQIEQAARHALDFLDSILMPNDEIPLFNDSAFEIAPSPRALFDYADRLFEYRRPAPPRQTLPDSAYFRLGEGNDRMIIDCGPISPSYQPGHTHCDMLSYELALDARPIVVDSGVHDYENSAERAYCRSTRAHNTVSVDGEDQSEIWGVFRVARRARPVLAELLPAERGGFRFVGVVDGFPRVAGRIRHRREITHDGVGLWTIRDEVSGAGHHVVDSWIHFHPDLTLSATDDSLSISDPAGTILASIEPHPGVSVTLESGLYFPCFGSKHTNQVLRLSAAGPLPLLVSYRIRKAVSVYDHAH
jgi:uncharacterized heparinase superfamily protein